MSFKKISWHRQKKRHYDACWSFCPWLQRPSGYVLPLTEFFWTEMTLQSFSSSFGGISHFEFGTFNSQIFLCIIPAIWLWCSIYAVPACILASYTLILCAGLSHRPLCKTCTWGPVWYGRPWPLLPLCTALFLLLPWLVPPCFLSSQVFWVGLLYVSHFFSLLIVHTVQDLSFHDVSSLPPLPHWGSAACVTVVSEAGPLSRDWYPE